MYKELQGKIAFVTGGSNGLGRQICLGLARENVKVAVNYHTDEKGAADVVDEIKSFGGEAFPLKGNVAKIDDVLAMTKTINHHYGKVDILINNAGISRDSILMRMSEKQWSDVIDINLTGVFNCSKAVIIGMMRRKKGKIVNISSVSGIAGVPGQTNYSASKGGVNSFTKALSKEVAQLGVTVNAICPGFLETGIAENMDEAYKSEMLKLIPAKRFGKTEDVIGLICFLVSDAADYITGQVINVDGGLYT